MTNNGVGYIYRHWIINDEGVEKSYIGQTTQKIERRFRNEGLGYFKKDSQTKFNNAINKYGWNNFTHDILLKIECKTDEELWFWLDEWECYYIWYYDSYYNGYNSTFGKGINNRGTKLNIEVRNKMSESHKGLFSGNKHPLYGKCGEDSPNYGRKNTEEVKKRMSGSRKEYYKQNGTEMLKGGNNPKAVKVICLETKEVFDCIAEARNKYGRVGIGKCCQNKAKSAGKHPVTGERLHWMYYEDYLKLKEKGE